MYDYYTMVFVTRAERCRKRSAASILSPYLFVNFFLIAFPVLEICRVYYLDIISQKYERKTSD